MAYVAIKKKHIIIVCVIIILFAVRLIYKFQYVSSYREIELNQVSRLSVVLLNVKEPYWVALTSLEVIENIEEKFNVSLDNVDLQKRMFIISYGAELKSMDYNVQEATFKTRGHYIAFPRFGELKPNTIFIYETEMLPLFSAEVAGFSPDYKGKFR